VEIGLKVDKDDDALSFRPNGSAVVESEEVEPGIILDFDAEGRVVGIETLNLSSRVTLVQLRILQFEII
jgi:uncharacterized protein YuzE